MKKSTRLLWKGIAAMIISFGFARLSLGNQMSDWFVIMSVWIGVIGIVSIAGSLIMSSQKR